MTRVHFVFLFLDLTITFLTLLTVILVGSSERFQIIELKIITDHKLKNQTKITQRLGHVSETHQHQPMTFYTTL